MVARNLIAAVSITGLLLSCGPAGVAEDPGVSEEVTFVPTDAACDSPPVGTLYVDHRAVEYGDGLSFAQPYRSIREALLQVPEDGHLCIAPGTYAEGTIELASKLVLEGAIDPDDGSARVVLDGEGVRQIFIVRDDVTLKNVALVRAWSPGDGGAIRNVGDGARLTLLDATISDSSATAFTLPGIQGEVPGRGGAIFNAGTVTIGDGSRIFANTATEGGGVYNDVGAVAVVVSGARIDGNSADGEGGGIYNAGTLTVTDGALVTENTALDGGGIFQAGTLSPGFDPDGVVDNRPNDIAP